jgi:hypothetical protein
MALSEINWKPDRKTLAEFSEIGMFVFGMLLAPVALWKGRALLAAALWSLGVTLRLVGWVRPGWLRPVFVGMSLAAWPIGWLVSHTALALMYFLVFTPLALVFRLIGRDALHRRLDRSRSSYWEPYNPHHALRRYLRQY